MEESDSQNVEIDILHPELLQKETLITLLSDRNVKTIGLEHLERQKLLDLYYQHVIPQPQRKYRKNRRGQAMTKQQIIMNKRKRSHSEMSSSSADSTSYNIKKSEHASPPVDAPKSGLINSFSLPSASERLKPPPSAINFEKKVIKLGGSSGNITPQLDSISVKSQPHTTKLTKSQPLELSKTNGINSASNSDNGQTHTVKITKIMPQKLWDSKPGKKIQLKRPVAIEVPSDTSPVEKLDVDMSVEKSEVHSQTEASTEPESVSGAEDEEVPVKKFKRVSVQWP